MRPTRSIYLLVILVALSKLGCIIVNSGGSGQAKFRETRTMTAPAGNALEARTVNGSVTIRRGDGTDTSITAKIAAQTQERLTATRVVAEKNAGGTLVVQIDWPGGRPANGESCALDIKVPASTSGFTVKTSNASIDLANLPGPAKLESSNGAITVASQSGPVEVSTSNGSVELKQIKGDAAARSSNGSIDLRDVAGKATARTSNGRVSVTLAQNGPVDVETSNGSAEVTLPGTYTGRMSLSTSNGSINYPKNKPFHSVNAEKHHVEFQIGDGEQAASTVRTSNGSVDVRIE